MEVRFEKVSRFKDEYFPLPQRSTKNSAGYDLYIAEDVILKPYLDIISPYLSAAEHDLAGTAARIKNNFKVPAPTLVSTGVKVYIPDGYYLQILPRSSTPLKYMLVVANSMGIIDADYADNPDNEGEIFLQLLNMGSNPVKLQVGDCIAQGIVSKYYVDDNDQVTEKRVGGFGSTHA